MKKRSIVILLIIAILLINVTFAYMMTSFKTNDVTIKVGNQDGGNGILVALHTDYVLIPKTAIATQPNETKILEYHLLVQSPETKSYTISHNLPEAYELTHNNTQIVFYTGSTYTIYISLLEVPPTTTQTFYINVQLV